MNNQRSFKLIKPLPAIPNKIYMPLIHDIHIQLESTQTDSHMKDILISHYNEDLNLIAYGSQLEKTHWLKKSIKIFVYNIDSRKLKSTYLIPKQKSTH